MSDDKKPLLASQRDSFSFWDTLDKAISVQRGTGTPDVSLYPSEASIHIVNQYGEKQTLGNCQRKSWFRNKLQRKKKAAGHLTELFEDILEEELTPKELWKFKVSSGVETDIREVSQSAEIYSDASHKFEWRIPVGGHYGEALIRGEVDLIVLCAPDSGIKIGIEIKSISGYYGQKFVFGYKTKFKTVKGNPKDSNLLQTVLYAYIFCLLKEEFSFFKLVYLSRENGQRTEFDIDLVPETVVQEGIQEVRHRVFVDQEPYEHRIFAEDILDSYLDLHRAVVDDILPPRDFDLVWSKERLAKAAERGLLTKTNKEKFDKGHKLIIGDFNCSYCNFWQMCYKSKMGEPIDYTNKTVTEDDLVVVPILIEESSDGN